MKTKTFFLALLLFFGAVPGFSQLFPTVNRPSSDEMSMLVVLFGQENEGKMDIVLNLPYSGWAPAVIGPDGKEIPFRNFDSGVDISNIYYSENLVSGEYTLTGFYHFSIDYSELEKYKEETGEDRARYAPFDNMAYNVRQLVALEEPVIINLVPDIVMTFGTFAVVFDYISGMAGTTDDRFQLDESKTRYSTIKPLDDHILRYIKPWRTRAWRGWNEKNSAEPL